MKMFDGCHAFIWNHYSENNCNCYFIDGDKKILIDPGHEHLFRHVQDGLQRLGIGLKDIDLVVATHGHPDHLEGARKFSRPTLFAMDKEEYDYLCALAGHYYKVPEPDFFLAEGEMLVGGESFQVIKAPGHTPSSVCLYWPAKQALFTGDVVFNQGIGRTDLPGGSGEMLKASIEKISGLEVEYLLPGHGDPVMGREAVQANFQGIRDYWYPYLTR